MAYSKRRNREKARGTRETHPTGNASRYPKHLFATRNTQTNLWRDISRSYHRRVVISTKNQRRQRVFTGMCIPPCDRLRPVSMCSASSKEGCSETQRRRGSLMSLCWQSCRRRGTYLGYDRTDTSNSIDTSISKKILT